MAPRKRLFVNYIIVDLPAPSNLTSAWSFGSLLGLVYLTQVVSGILLAIHYSSDVASAFQRVVHIQRDVGGGWFIRTLHSNGASLFFIFIYIHMARGIYYGSYRRPTAWLRGVTLYIVSIAVAFIGYLLPWGQMRFWGATVITNLFRAIPYVGNDIVLWMWGGFAVGGATLSRFFTGHFLIPLVMALLVIIHLHSLHTTGSSNPLGVRRVTKVVFHPYYTAKDAVGFIIGGILLSLLVFYSPFILGDPDNWVPANNIVTPAHIKPEWYFLWVYAILRSVPNKLGGVVLLVRALLGLYLLVNKDAAARSRTWWLVTIIILLRWVGARPVEYPYVSVGAALRIVYFILLLLSSRVRIYEIHWCCINDTCPRLLKLLPSLLIVVSVSLILGAHFFMVLPRLFLLRIALSYDLIAAGAVWLGLAVVIVYIGGMIILFAYFLTLTHSRPLLLNYGLLLFPLVLVDAYTPVTSLISSPAHLINHLLVPAIVFSVAWLFLAMVVVVKLSSFPEVPLRNYV